MDKNITNSLTHNTNLIRAHPDIHWNYIECFKHALNRFEIKHIFQQENVSTFFGIFLVIMMLLILFL